MKVQKNRIMGKSSPVGAIIASVCIVVYCIAIVSAAVRIFISIDQRRDIAEREFTHIADVASFAGAQGLTEASFVQTMNDLLISSSTIEAIIISAPEGHFAFERQQYRSVRWANNAPQFIRRFDNFQAMFRPLPGLGNVNMQGVAAALDYAHISSILGQTLIIIMSGLALAFFTLLMEFLLVKQAADNRASLFPDSHSHKRSFAERRRAPAGAGAAAGAGVAASRLYPEVEREEVKEEIKEEELAADPPEGPEPYKKADSKGLYSPRANIGWEEHASDKLEAELHRCSSSELDLILVAMEFKSISDDGFLKMFASDAAVFFGGRDVLFEKGDRGIFAITPSVSLEKGVAMAEQFHKQVSERYSHALSAGDLHIGITSRRERLVTAERMMIEANEALRRAKAENVPILAFKSDPDKYRAFISKNAK
ncbi:MAG: hypothetical protein FWG66_16485 [Spirochaetes bacterium]|nr:hypothetical protein [Spirochaetota bacterium]